ncbi:hypothetical protein [Vreelandella alkaliphila]|uniref:Uncharacterized protein n=1 Tax=Vreelandella alkaliphila TaxID=272774 RepID=A0AAJ2RW78_9GAMM|nr:hypothetical protein [Halomonas alkaliphila]MDX5979608.1 hypothetical protein [Halomonas alkaliphila]
MQVNLLAKLALKLLNIVREALIPSYTTEYVAFYDNGDGVLVPTLPARRVVVEEDGEPEGVELLRSLSWLGKSWQVREAGSMMSWQEYQRLP